MRHLVAAGLSLALVFPAESHLRAEECYYWESRVDTPDLALEATSASGAGSSTCST